MVEDLIRYYRSAGIAAQEFRCPMAPSCRAASKDFISAREAFVGSEYEKGTLPRVLFISLDPAKDLSDRDPAKRALMSMRQWEESGSRPEQGSPGFRKSDHWYQTHKFAHELLAPVACARGIVPFAFACVNKYFAHTNSAKCKDASQGTNQGRAVLFKNCRRFIPGEVENLLPDVIVTQGSFARESIAGAFRTLQQLSLRRSSYHAELVQIASRPVLKFEIAHPKARGGRYQREVREAWEWYMRVGHGFLLNGPEALRKMRFGEA